MRMLVVLLALSTLLAGPASASETSSPPRGNDHFRLGMLRAEVDSAVAARGLRIISDGTAFLVCAGADSTIEYEMYSFFRAPHGIDCLWKVTLGYRTTATLWDYATAHDELKRLLGEPATDSWKGLPSPTDDPRPPQTTHQAIWNDGTTLVQLGAHWGDIPDPSTDRMKVIWIDRRLQRSVIVRLKNDKVSANN
jgi:hypothetical protein